MLTNHGSLTSVHLVLGALGLLAVPGVTVAQEPRVGQVQKLTVITLSIQVGSTEKECKRVTYTPPPGWYVRGHEVECKEKTGHSSFTVNTMPQDWVYVSEEQVTQSYRVLLDMAAQARDAGMQAKFSLEQEKMLSEIRKGKSSHHALVVEASVRGEGFLRGGGGIQLTVTAELVYVGTTESLQRVVSQRKGNIGGTPTRAAGRPPR